MRAGEYTAVDGHDDAAAASMVEERTDFDERIRLMNEQIGENAAVYNRPGGEVAPGSALFRPALAGTEGAAFTYYPRQRPLGRR
jgi:hypothetical protein